MDDQIAMTPLDTTSAPAARLSNTASPRLVVLDRLRVGLTALVVLHHVAIVYGAAAPFYYVEPPATSPGAFRALLVFVIVNQAWFMGAFFFISGVLTPSSIDRHGVTQFLRGRLIRLGMPLVVFTFVLNPLSMLGIYAMPQSLTGISGPPSWRTYPHLVGMGPMWFAAMLLGFSVLCALVHVGARWIRGGPAANVRVSNRPAATPRGAAVGVVAFVLVLAAAEYAWRIVVPIGRQIAGFPSLAYLPQYAAFYFIGILAGRRGWLVRLGTSVGRLGGVVAAASALLLLPLAFSGRPFSLELSAALDRALGGRHWQSAVYCLFDATFAAGLIAWLACVLRRLDIRGAGPIRVLSTLSYGVYILHSPILVGVAVLLGRVALPAMIKFALVSIVVVPLCFGVVHLVRRVSGVARVV